MAEQSEKEEAEARRALAFGEQCFLAGDVARARGCARYALSLAPGLPGAEQALVAYDVHAAARGPDWHAVLGARDDVRRQYRRLCLLVQPDKNPCVAADSAFKIVQAAYDALSAAADRRAREEQEVRRFWQAAPYDVTPPPPAHKQPPIAPPTPPPAGHGQPAPPPLAAYGQPAPRQSPIFLPPQRPSCPLLPYCLFCRPRAPAGPNEGFAMPTGINGQQGGLCCFSVDDQYYYY